MRPFTVKQIRCLFSTAVKGRIRYARCNVCTRPYTVQLDAKETNRKQLCGREWQVWILRERGEEGISFIINERCWDCFEDDFVEAIACWSWTAYHLGLDGLSITHLPFAVPYYLGVKGHYIYSAVLCKYRHQKCMNALCLMKMKEWMKTRIRRWCCLARGMKMKEMQGERQRE